MGCASSTTVVHDDMEEIRVTFEDPAALIPDIPKLHHRTSKGFAASTSSKAAAGPPRAIDHRAQQAVQGWTEGL